MEIYWVKLKDGTLRYYEKAPKRNHVTEKIIEKGTGINVGMCVHQFTCGSVVRLFTSHCGYDRGKKKHGILKKMLSI